MHKINNGRLILAGVVTAVILAVLDDIDNGLLLAQGWTNGLKAFGLPPISVKGIIAMNLWCVAIGFLGIWLYAAVRPRFGAGPKTALITAAVVWAFAWPLAMLAPVVTHLIPKAMAINACLLGIPEIAIALLVGAAIYKEESSGTDRVIKAAA